MKIILVVTLLLFYGITSNMYQFGYGISDAFWRVVWAMDEDTVWAENYSEKNFDKIELGMSSNEVLSLMGTPLNEIKKCSDICFWYYTWHSRGNADFDQRWVVFNRVNKVIEVRKSFYID